MKRRSMMKSVSLASIMVLAFLTAGCSSYYYRVTDPATGKSYYTDKVEDAGKAGAVKFKDAKTGSKITLQSSDVKEINEEEFDAAMKPAMPAPPAKPAAAGPAAAPAAPAAAPAP
jgi:PBP1b-binding outer membrane lipoprotein LpoB